MADASHNSLSKRIREFNELERVQSMLLQGTTINAIAEALGCSKEQARRIIRAMKEMGWKIADDFTLGTREPTVYKLKAADCRIKAAR